MSQPVINDNNKLNGLDHLRALAIILVFMFHYGRLFPSPSWFTAICKFGWTGVDLFFVLSGYLIASQLFLKIATTNAVSLRDFFIKRFFRIIPPYIIVVTAYFCLPYIREWEALAPLWKYLTFTHNLGLDIRSQRTFSHAWSLCIEEQFYLCLPLILALLLRLNAFKRGIYILAGLFLFGFIIRYYCYTHFVAPVMSEVGNTAAANWYKWIYYPTYSRLDGLLTGVSIAALFQFRPLLRDRICRYGNVWLVVSFSVLIIMWTLGFTQESLGMSVFGFPLVDINYGVMVIGAISPGSLLYRVRSSLTTRIAVLSYAAYLVHKSMIHITQLECSKLGIAADSNLMLLLCIITSFFAAWLMNKLIEQPSLRLRNKVLSKMPRQ